MIPITSLARISVTPRYKQELQRELQSRSLWRIIPFPKGSSLKAAKKQDEPWLKVMMFSYNLSKCLTLRGQLKQSIFKKQIQSIVFTTASLFTDELPTS